ncbi:MAG TPA: D-amino acid aminotransferase [Candidatus Tenderia electrophaga]|uniref:Aminodeoxychorismate lyase n=1 Tax=Candidatus Tenderia electrophaga TaxID=1748243 RepID=A0A832J6C7_9GAMM|nr:D-amino acid aminotransferase [Candidatus Tenderia electrophaga]
MNTNTATVYLNGKFLPQDQAFVPVMDRGFVFGDGVYEVIPVYGGRLFRLDEHLRRLNDSLAGIRLNNPMSAGEWTGILNRIVAENGAGEQSVYLQLTRGHAPRDHGFPEDTQATIFISSSPLTPVADELLKNGVAAISLEDIRWKYCHIKAIALLPNILLRQQAIEAGAQEAILIRDGLITEGAASNLFMVKDGLIKTPAKGPFLLPGITRDLVLELAAANNIQYQEGSFGLDELQQADEIWLSSSTKEVLPVTRLDDKAVGNGQPGPVWQRMRRLYQDYKQALIAGEAE